MNIRKYFDLIVLVILLQIISNSSADEWKKLKRKLTALLLLHSIRVKTIIPLPFPLPLPIVVKKDVNPVVLPPKKVPFLVPKPVPYYQIIPNFVPIYPKDIDSHEKQWSGEENLLPSQQLTYEDYLIPSGDIPGLNPDFYKLSASEVQHPESVHNLYPSEKPSKFNVHQFHHDEFIDPFEMNAKHKFPKNNRKLRKSKQKPKHLNDFKGFAFNDDNQEKYEDLDMVSTALKSEPQDRRATLNPYSGTRTDDIDVSNHRLSTLGQSLGYEMNKQLLMDSEPNVDKNRGNGSKNKQIIEKDSPGVRTTTKKIKLGEIRLRPNQLKALLAHHSHSNSEQN